MPDRRTASLFPPTAMKRMPCRVWVTNKVSTMYRTATIHTGAGMPAYLRVPMKVSWVRPGMVYPPATTAASPDVTDSVPIVTMSGLNPRSAIRPLATPTTTPITSATTMPSHTGLCPASSLPQMTPARAATPGIEMSSAPEKTPAATPAAYTAVSAAAFAIRTALLHLAKNGLAQTENARMSRTNSTIRPRSRAKMSARIPRESLVCSSGAAPTVSSSTDEDTAPTARCGFAGTVMTCSLACGDDLLGDVQLLAGLLGVGLHGGQGVEGLDHVPLEVQVGRGVDLAGLNVRQDLIVPALIGNAGKGLSGRGEGAEGTERRLVGGGHHGVDAGVALQGVADVRLGLGPVALDEIADDLGLGRRGGQGRYRNLIESDRAK